MALCSNITTGIDQNASGSFELAQIGATSPSGLKLGSHMKIVEEPIRDQAPALHEDIL
jgi:hypothetical protein